MTEEELEKKGEQLDNANQAEKVAPNAAINEKPAPVEQAITGLENRAKELREYAASPVRIDKGGQTNWMSEIERVRNMYSESPEQQAAREKRERTNRRIAALSDGLMALSNVAGAMAGATPIKPSVTMSAAHRKAVEDAARRRRENAKLYDTARKYYAGLQYKQDKDNADKEAAERKARQAARKDADTLETGIAKMRVDREKNKSDQEYKDKVLGETKRYHDAQIQLDQQRNAIAASKGGGSGGKNDDELQAAYNYFASLTEDEKKQYRDKLKRGYRAQVGTTGTGPLKEPVYGTQYKADDESFVKAVWNLRKAYLRNNGRGDEIATGGYNTGFSPKGSSGKGSWLKTTGGGSWLKSN